MHTLIPPDRLGTCKGCGRPIIYENSNTEYDGIIFMLCPSYAERQLNLESAGLSSYQCRDPLLNVFEVKEYLAELIDLNGEPTTTNY